MSSLIVLTVSTIAFAGRRVQGRLLFEQLHRPSSTAFAAGRARNLTGTYLPLSEFHLIFFSIDGSSGQFVRYNKVGIIIRYLHQGTWFWGSANTWRGWYPDSLSSPCLRYKKRKLIYSSEFKLLDVSNIKGSFAYIVFSGADWGRTFVGITKKTWVNAYLMMMEVTGEMLPPTHAALLPHYLHANSVTMQDKSYLTNCPVLPPIEENRWNSESGGYIPVRFLALPAPKAVLELIKRVCKAGCKGRCSCSNNQPFTLCYGGDCVNTIMLDIEDDDDEDEYILHVWNYGRLL